MNYTIRDVQCAVISGGPCVPVVTCEVMLDGWSKDVSDPEKVFFVSLTEVDGMPNIYHTDRSTYDDQLTGNDDPDFLQYLEDHRVEVDCYDDIFEHPESPMYELYHYLTYLVRCDWDEYKPFVQDTMGKVLGSFPIPMIDLEEEYWDEEEI